MRIQLRKIYILCIWLIPCFGTILYQTYRPSTDHTPSVEGLTVYMKQNGIEGVLDFEAYAVGVMSAYCTSDTSEEMQKVLAVLVRTYVYYVAKSSKFVDGNLIGLPWYSISERRIKGIDEKQLKKALLDTSGMVLRYNGEVILPLFFQCSNGKTRNYADIWGINIPYLTTVSSASDPETSFFVEKVFRNLRFCGFAEGNDLRGMEKDALGYVKHIQVGETTYNGEDFRLRAQLPSACFAYEKKPAGYVFTCYGRGHGVGLSLCGAEQMALNGKTWKEILLWYFPGTNV